MSTDLEDASSTTYSEGALDEDVVTFEDAAERCSKLLPITGAARPLRCIARGLDGAWAIGSRCVLLDFTYAFAWSRLLAFVSLVLVVYVFAEQAFDAVIPVQSCANCFEARQVNACSLGGTPAPGDGDGSQIDIDPFGEARLSVSGTGRSALILAAFVALTNTRYLRESCFMIWVLRPLVCILCFLSLIGGIQDFRRCTPSKSTGNWLEAASNEAIAIADYCSITAPGRDPVEASMSAAVLHTWAAWMSNTTFLVDFSNPLEGPAYCNEIEISTIPCIFWLNSSSTGNTITCQLPFDISMLPVMSETSIWLALSVAQCKAHVHGRSLALDSHHVPVPKPALVVPHVLSLATRGFRCPAAWAASGEGPSQLGEGTAASCSFDEDLLRLEQSMLVPTEHAKTYLQEDYLRCAVDQMRSCRDRYFGRPRTVYRSGIRMVALVFLCLSYLWMLILRHYARNARTPDFSFVPLSAIRVIRALLASRVVLGLAVAFILQVGFTYFAVQVAFPQLDRLQAPFAPRDLFRQLGKLLICLHCVIVLAAIVLNVVGYLRLREQLLRLPRACFFGEAPAPADYHGPDLHELREMGSSSVLYAAYFPGMVFWKFFFAAWMLGLVFVAPIGLFRIVLQPVSRRIQSAESLWDMLSECIFVASILMSHYMTRLFLQRCLLRYREDGLRIRCLCLFTYWEMMTCMLGLALGAWTSLYDFAKGFISTAVASLLLSKPNFTQFGELSDYVYCTYCASLYMERVAEDDYRDHFRAWRENQQVHGDKNNASESEDEDTSAKYEDFGSDSDAWEFWQRGRDDRALEEESWRIKCCPRMLGFLVIFVGIPCIVKLCLNYIGSQYNYTCKKQISFLPAWFCDAMLELTGPSNSTLARDAFNLVASHASHTLDLAVELSKEPHSSKVGV